MRQGQRFKWFTRILSPTGTERKNSASVRVLGGSTHGRIRHYSAVQHHNARAVMHFGRAQCVDHDVLLQGHTSLLWGMLIGKSNARD
jgi:hypothetical protein